MGGEDRGKRRYKEILAYLKAEKGLADNTSFAYENDLVSACHFRRRRKPPRKEHPFRAGFSRQAMMR